MRASARSLLVLAFFAATSAVAADVWRWTDAQGVVHYSDVPVPGAVRVKRTSGPSSASVGSSPKASPAVLVGPPTPLDEQRQLADASRAVQQDLAKRRAEQCKTASERYDSLINSHRVYKEDKGQRSYLSAKELDEARARARQDRDTLCTNNAR